MIKANELRIGNILQRPSGSIVFVAEILKDGFHAFDGSIDGGSGAWSPFNENQNYLQRVSLTEEWLLKFGFTSLGQNHYCDGLCNNTIELHKEKYYFGNDEVGGIWVLMEFVHEFQNIYYALNKKELELKELVSKLKPYPKGEE